MRTSWLAPCYTDSVFHEPGEADMNLTITVGNDVLKRARIRAVKEDTSVNAVLRDCLETYAGGTGRKRHAVHRLLMLSETTGTGRGAATWTRDELHER